MKPIFERGKVDGKHWLGLRKKMVRLLDVSAYDYPNQGALILPEGLSPSPIDPINAFKAAPRLALNKKYRLKGEIYRDGPGNGYGRVFVYPSKTHSSLQKGLSLEAAPDVLEGDGTPESYAQASLLVRELDELGALWHGCRWSTHDLIVSSPWSPRRLRIDGDFFPPMDQWIWNQAKPKRWSPVWFSKTMFHVRFYSYSGLGQHQIVEHTDSFRKGTFIPRCRSKVVAYAEGGYIP